eukprot:3023579-Alexandrium_andersonii.AAC.1
MACSVCDSDPCECVEPSSSGALSEGVQEPTEVGVQQVDSGSGLERGRAGSVGDPGCGMREPFRIQLDALIPCNQVPSGEECTQSLL